MARLYSNENVPLPVVEELRRLGHDVLTSVEAGNANRSVPDNEVLSFSMSRERIVLTANRMHFVRLHKSGVEHAGIVVFSFDSDFVALASKIDRALSAAADVTGLLLRVNLS
ncbi:MAG: DUF5615 family PIN-like protein [Acidobacteriia bacterium]|nr:DUF5615 family PIN-like protein [Terriglobia bacterium]